MPVRIRKWGNSAAVRIPAPVLEAAGVGPDDEVEVREFRGKILIEPLRKKSVRLDDLIRGITSENLHEEADFGGPKGHEIW